MPDAKENLERCRAALRHCNDQELVSFLALGEGGVLDGQNRALTTRGYVKW